MNRRELLGGAFLVLAGAGGATYFLDDDSDAIGVAAVESDPPGMNTPPPSPTATPESTPDRNQYDGEAIDGEAVTECEPLEHEFMFAKARELDGDPAIHVRFRVRNSAASTRTVKATATFFDGSEKVGSSIDSFQVKDEPKLADLFLKENASRAESFRVRLKC